MEAPADRVLVVEDDPLVRRSLLFALASLGPYVVGASGPAEARTLLGEQRFSHVLADYNLGGGTTGAELLAEVRATQPTCRRILMSGSTEAFARTLEPGLAHALLSKPFSRQQIAEALKLATAAP